jgi:hypothetical protein
MRGAFRTESVATLVAASRLRKVTSLQALRSSCPPRAGVALSHRY